MATSVDATEIPLRLKAGRIENGEIPFSLFATLTADSFDPIQRTFTLIIVVLTMDETGKILFRRGESLAGVVDSRQELDLIEHGSEYRASFPCAGATTGRVIVLDEVTGRVGSVTVAPL